MKKGMCLSAVIIVSQFCIANSWASGANFKISGDNIEQPEQNGPYTAAITVGQSVEIIAKGFAYPVVRVEGVTSPQEREEAAKGHPFKAEAGTWMFDDAKLQLVSTAYNETQYKLVVKATTPGQYKVRFVGVILGRSKTYEIQVNVSQKKATVE